MEENKDVSKKGDQPSKIALFSTLLNISAAGTKGLLAWLSGSSALLADTIHGLSDSFASFLVLLGIWISTRNLRAFQVFSHVEAEVTVNDANTFEEIHQKLCGAENT